MNVYDFAMQMEKDGEKFYSELAEISQVEGIRTILTMLASEEMSRKFYLDKAAETQQEDEKQIFSCLASEEEQHLRIMENIVEFVARPEPGFWLENAEWHHLEEY